MGAISQLHLDYNKLTGILPTELAGANQTLLTLNLKGNRISGPIPTEYGSFTKPIRLYLHDNQLQFQLPSEIGLLTGLNAFQLQGNEFSGSIPTEIGMWGMNTTVIECDEFSKQTFGKYLTFGNNAITLSLSEWLPVQSTGSVSLSCRLTFCLFSDINLSRNRLKGTLPTELGLLTVWRELHLQNNQKSKGM